jgi:voltage-gated potassium channel
MQRQGRLLATIRMHPIMAHRTYQTFMQALSEKRFFILLVSILLTIGLTPFLEDFIQTKILLDIFLTVIFFAIIFAIGSKRSHLIIASILVLPLVVSTWSYYFLEYHFISPISRIFGALFFGYAVVIILQIIARSAEVKRETIFAAIVAYLLIALMWSFFYMILESFIPGSFAFPEQGAWKVSTRFHYLSFITITTLGYGDITPLTNKASALTMLEAVIGQIYMVVLVAWLVGMYVSKKSK